MVESRIGGDKIETERRPKHFRRQPSPGPHAAIVLAERRATSLYDVHSNVDECSIRTTLADVPRPLFSKLD
jgi:hypothetical protein